MKKLTVALTTLVVMSSMAVAADDPSTYTATVMQSHCVPEGRMFRCTAVLEFEDKLLLSERIYRTPIEEGDKIYVVDPKKKQDIPKSILSMMEKDK